MYITDYYRTESEVLEVCGLPVERTHYSMFERPPSTKTHFYVRRNPTCSTKLNSHSQKIAKSCFVSVPSANSQDSCLVERFLSNCIQTWDGDFEADEKQHPNPFQVPLLTISFCRCLYYRFRSTRSYLAPNSPEFPLHRCNNFSFLFAIIVIVIVPRVPLLTQWYQQTSELQEWDKSTLPNYTVLISVVFPVWFRLHPTCCGQCSSFSPHFLHH